VVCTLDKQDIRGTYVISGLPTFEIQTRILFNKLPKISMKLPKGTLED